MNGHSELCNASYGATDIEYLNIYICAFEPFLLFSELDSFPAITARLTFPTLIFPWGKTPRGGG